MIGTLRKMIATKIELNIFGGFRSREWKTK